MKVLKKFYSWNHYIYFIFFLAVLVFTVSAYVDIKNKEDFIQYNNPVKVYILNIHRFAKSSSTCDIKYNNRIYKEIPYPGKLKEGEYNDDIYIKEIKEDEAIAYFIRFSNNDILHIYEYVDGLENWFLNFEIVSPKNENYNKIITHMNETWVKRLLSY